MSQQIHKSHSSNEKVAKFGDKLPKLATLNPHDSSQSINILWSIGELVIYAFCFHRCDLVCLERAEEGMPCVITLLCTPNSASVISSLQIVSEARTIEMYSLSGDYCGTCRGEEVQRSHTDGYFFFTDSFLLQGRLYNKNIHTHTHIHIYIYILEVGID